MTRKFSRGKPFTTDVQNPIKFLLAAALYAVKQLDDAGAEYDTFDMKESVELIPAFQYSATYLVLCKKLPDVCNHEPFLKEAHAIAVRFARLFNRNRNAEGLECVLSCRTFYIFVAGYVMACLSNIDRGHITLSNDDAVKWHLTRVQLEEFAARARTRLGDPCSAGVPADDIFLNARDVDSQGSHTVH
jgi:hypothetical protein